MHTMASKNSAAKGSDRTAKRAEIGPRRAACPGSWRISKRTRAFCLQLDVVRLAAGAAMSVALGIPMIIRRGEAEVAAPHGGGLLVPSVPVCQDEVSPLHVDVAVAGH